MWSIVIHHRSDGHVFFWLPPSIVALSTQCCRASHAVKWFDAAIDKAPNTEHFKTWHVRAQTMPREEWSRSFHIFPHWDLFDGKHYNFSKNDRKQVKQNQEQHGAVCLTIGLPTLEWFGKSCCPFKSPQIEVSTACSNTHMIVLVTYTIQGPKTHLYPGYTSMPK